MRGKHRFRRCFPLFCIDGHQWLRNVASLPVQRENECDFMVFIGKMKAFVGKNGVICKRIINVIIVCGKLSDRKAKTAGWRRFLDCSDKIYFCLIAAKHSLQ